MFTHIAALKGLSPGKSVLRNYIDDFIQRAFLQHIKTDYSKRYYFLSPKKRKKGGKNEEREREREREKVIYLLSINLFYLY